VHLKGEGITTGLVRKLGKRAYEVRMGIPKKAVGEYGIGKSTLLEFRKMNGGVEMRNCGEGWEFLKTRTHVKRRINLVDKIRDGLGVEKDGRVRFTKAKHGVRLEKAGKGASRGIIKELMGDGWAYFSTAEIKALGMERGHQAVFMENNDKIYLLCPAGKILGYGTATAHREAKRKPMYMRVMSEVLAYLQVHKGDHLAMLSGGKNIRIVKSPAVDDELLRAPIVEGWNVFLPDKFSKWLKVDKAVDGEGEAALVMERGSMMVEVCLRDKTGRMRCTIRFRDPPVGL